MTKRMRERDRERKINLKKISKRKELKIEFEK
jgi:hypothetical protein